MSRKTLPFPQETVWDLEALAHKLSGLPRERLQFERRTRRTHLSTSEVAEVAVRIGMAELARAHGLTPEPG